MKQINILKSGLLVFGIMSCTSKINKSVKPTDFQMLDKKQLNLFFQYLYLNQEKKIKDFAHYDSTGKVIKNFLVDMNGQNNNNNPINDTEIILSDLKEYSLSYLSNEVLDYFSHIKNLEKLNKENLERLVSYSLKRAEDNIIKSIAEDPKLLKRISYDEKIYVNELFKYIYRDYLISKNNDSTLWNALIKSIYKNKKILNTLSPKSIVYLLKYLFVKKDPRLKTVLDNVSDLKLKNIVQHLDKSPFLVKIFIKNIEIFKGRKFSDISGYYFVRLILRSFRSSPICSNEVLLLNLLIQNCNININTEISFVNKLVEKNLVYSKSLSILLNYFNKRTIYEYNSTNSLCYKILKSSLKKRYDNITKRIFDKNSKNFKYIIYSIFKCQKLLEKEKLKFCIYFIKYNKNFFKNEFNTSKCKYIVKIYISTNENRECTFIPKRKNKNDIYLGEIPKNEFDKLIELKDKAFVLYEPFKVYKFHSHHYEYNENCDSDHHANDNCAKCSFCCLYIYDGQNLRVCGNKHFFHRACLSNRACLSEYYWRKGAFFFSCSSCKNRNKYIPFEEEQDDYILIDFKEDKKKIKK